MSWSFGKSRNKNKNKHKDKTFKKQASDSFISRLNFFKKKQPKNYRTINGWILGETLGMGGYSKVKLGVNEKTRVKAALKIMFADQTGTISASKRKQLTRELNVMKQVKQKNVIQLIEYDDDAKYPESNGTKTSCILVVLEYAPGGELFDYLMFTGKFDECATRTYFHQFMDGLSAMHEAGIAHRDLKPENLLLDDKFNLKIADFGFATEFKTEDGYDKKLTTACGTKGYLAPELLKGKKYGHKCDIFAAGIIMFTTFAGFPPFQNAVDSDWWWDKLSKGWKYLEQSKRMQNQQDVRKHKQAGLNKKSLFWKAHERSVIFPADFKYLIEYTLHPMPSHRYDIDQIRQDKWFSGKIYDSTRLKHFLTGRVNTVRKERIAKIRKQLDEQNTNTSDTDYVTKRNDDESQFTPMQKRATELDNKNEWVKYIEHVENEPFGVTMYEFNTHCPPAEMGARIERVAARTNAKCTIAPSSNIVIVSVNIKFVNVQGANVLKNTNNLSEEENSVNSTDNDHFNQTNEENDEENQSLSEDVVFAVKQFMCDDDDLNKFDTIDEKEFTKNTKVKFRYNKEYKVLFKRLKGSHQHYKQAVEDFFYAKEICAAMIFDEEEEEEEQEYDEQEYDDL